MDMLFTNKKGEIITLPLGTSGQVLHSKKGWINVEFVDDIEESEEDDE